MKQFILLFFTFTSFLTFSQSNFEKIINKKMEDNPVKAIIYIDSLLQNNKSLNRGDLYYSKGLAYHKNKKIKKATAIYHKILKFAKKNDSAYVKSLYMLSVLNSNNKKYIEATDLALKALQLAKKNNYKKYIAKANNSLSYIAYLNNDYENSLNYLMNSAQLQIKTNDSLELSGTYNNIAIIYKNIGRLKKALNYNLKSLNISELIADSIGIGKTYSNIGRLYEFQGNLNKAIEYYQFAAKNNNEANIQNSIPYRNIGSIYFKKNDYKKTEEFLLKAIKVEEKEFKKNISNNIYKTLLTSAIHQKKFKKALFYQTKADSISKLNFNKDHDQKIKALESQHLLFENENKLKQEQNINSKNRIIFISISVFILLIGIYLLQKNRISKLRLNQEKIQLEQQILRSQMNPHFIFNVLAAIQNSLLDNNPIASATYLSKFAKLIRQNFDFIHKRTITLEEEIDSLTNYMDTQKLRFHDKFNYQIIIEEGIDIKKVEIPPLLLQPFVENSIEHGFKNKKEKGNLILNIERKNNHICYTIKDNGIGFKYIKKDNKDHAIDVFKKRIKFLNNKNKGNFQIDSSHNGTTVKFCLDIC